MMGMGRRVAEYNCNKWERRQVVGREEGGSSIIDVNNQGDR